MTNDDIVRAVALSILPVTGLVGVWIAYHYRMPKRDRQAELLERIATAVETIAEKLT